MRNYLLYLFLSLTMGATAQTDEQVDLKALYQEIDEAISQSPQFVAERGHQISACQDSFLTAKSTEERLQKAERLFLLYEPYKNDSALYYAETCISLADSLHRSDLIGKFRSRLAFQCSSSGRYTESLEQLRQVKRSDLDKNGLCDYYNAWMHVCGELGFYTQRPDVRQRYYDLQNLYRDSVLAVADDSSERYLHLKMDILSARRLFQDALELSDEWFKKVADNTHESAFAAFYRAMVYANLNNHDMTCYWLGKSALDDIRCAVMNQASLLFLAERLADDGDIDRAHRYVEFTKGCNVTFCPLLRNYQVNSVVHVYEKSSQAAQKRANTILIVASVVIVLFIIALFYTILLIRKTKHNNNKQ